MTKQSTLIRAEVEAFAKKLNWPLEEMVRVFIAMNDDVVAPQVREAFPEFAEVGADHAPAGPGSE